MATFKKKAGQDSDLPSKAILVERTETHKMVSEISLDQLEQEKKMLEDGLVTAQARMTAIDEEIVKVKALVE